MVRTLTAVCKKDGGQVSVVVAGDGFALECGICRARFGLPGTWREAR